MLRNLAIVLAAFALAMVALQAVNYCKPAVLLSAPHRPPPPPQFDPPPHDFFGQ